MNLKSKIQNRNSRRRGVTIVEVLFAILVATVGVFSVIVIFPFASSQARRARVNDMLAAAGRSAFHAFDARGMRRATDRWLACNPVNGAFVPALGVLQKGESICIDPRTIAAHTTTNAVPPATVPIWPLSSIQAMTNQSSTGSPGGLCTQVFPYVQPGTTPYLASVNPIVFNGLFMRRITLWSGAYNSLGQKLAMTLPQANALFMIDDDVSYQRSEKDKSAAATQDFVQLLGGATPQWLKRDSVQKISWIATLVPQIDVSGVPSDEYTLSVVMMYDRPNDPNNLEFTTASGTPGYPKKERVVKGAWQGFLSATGVPTGGTTGGEIYLAVSATPIAGASPNDVKDQLKLRPNEWVMVSGTYNGVTRFQWYRVSDSDNEPTLNTNAGVYELYATLIGQDWNTSFQDPQTPLLPAIVANGGFPVNVTIVEGAFAVFEKTIRLEYGSSM